MSSQHNTPKVMSASKAVTPASPHVVIPNFFAGTHKEALVRKTITWDLQDETGKHYLGKAHIDSADKDEHGNTLPRAQQQDKACWLWCMKEFKRQGTNEIFFTINEDSLF